MPPAASFPRALAEALISLLIAVILFRTFLAEGYMISTGSMAPALLGYHKRVACPTCQAEFAFGVAYDTDDPADSESDDARRQKAVCPNCGQTGILVSSVPRNHGDQLLVFKQTYLYRNPGRWEVIVFRNPADPTEAFVKRVVGLPGETMQIVDGDVVINGELCRKNWADQRELRQLVHEHHAADEESLSEKSPAVHPHWVAEDPESGGHPAWQADGASFRLTDDDGTETAWVNYAHWIRRGGQHQTSVALADWPKDIPPDSVPPAGLRYDKLTHRLSCVGALPEKVRDTLYELSQGPEFRDVVEDLYEQSHIAPIADFYGYNSADQQQVPTVVRDLMWSGRVQIAGGRGEFRIEMSTGPMDFAAVFDFDRGEVRLYVEESKDPAATAGLPLGLLHGDAVVEMSLFDQQALVAVNGVTVLPPVHFQTPAGSRVTRHPVRFGAHGLKLQVNDIKLYRDVYYTAQHTRHAVGKPHTLGSDEYFVLGDNSPVSHDSRRWNAAPVPGNLLVGKPFLVHLPSKPGQLRVGAHEMQLRLPDVERIRLLK